MITEEMYEALIAALYAIALDETLPPKDRIAAIKALAAEYERGDGGVTLTIVDGNCPECPYRVRTV